MAEKASNSSSIDSKSGFCKETKIFHSLRPRSPLPPETRPLSAAHYAFSLLRITSSSSSLATTTALIEAATGLRISYSDFILRTQMLAASLQTKIGLSKGDIAFVLSPTCLQIPILYFSLLSFGVVVSPANPLGTEAEISRQIHLANPAIAFATSATAHKLPSLRHPTILLDSSDFHSMMTTSHPTEQLTRSFPVNQSDTAAILYSSGTTGRLKRVQLTHRNYIAMLSGSLAAIPPVKEENVRGSVQLVTVPLFHSFGFAVCLMGVALGETVVLMERFDLEVCLKAVEAYGVTSMLVAPPVVAAMAKAEVVDKYDLRSLQRLGSGGAPLGKQMWEKFVARFPNVLLTQGYGLTESAAGVATMLGPDEAKRYGSVGRLAPNVEVKIVDPATGLALPPHHQGELWFLSPGIMKGYIGDEEATANALDSKGWLKTGDLCYIDSDGFVYIIDRLKELIKYKAYQVPPAELEHMLQSHPEIVDSAVIPYPDEEAGQIPMAFVVREPGSNLNEAQVKDFIAKQVAPHKKLRRVAFISSIPKTPTGKILRRELINYALSAPSSKL